MGFDSARSTKRRVSNRSRKTAVPKDGAPAAEFEDFYAPHTTDRDPPQEMMRGRNENARREMSSRRIPTSCVVTAVGSELALRMG